MRRITILLAIAMVVCAIPLTPGRAFAEASLTLKDAIARALVYAPAAEAAAAQSEFGDAKMAEARAPLFPTISANGEYNQAPGYDQTISNRGLTLAQLALDYTAFDGGRRTAASRAARYAAEATRLGVDIARTQIVFDTTVAYFDLRRARAGVAEQQASLARLDRYLAIVQNLQHSGRAIANDVLRIRSAHDASQLALAAANQAADHAAIVLGSMIGEPGTFTRPLADGAELPAPPSWPIDHSPVFTAAQRQLASAQAAVDAAEAERAPTVKLALTSGWEGIDPPKTFGHHLGASYDGAISVPIFQGGLVRAHVDEAQATRHAAVAQLRQIELDLKRDLADAQSRYQSALHQLAILGSAATTAEDAFALDWTRFLGGGNVTLLEVMDAYQTAQNLKLTRFDQEFAQRQAAAQAALILGVGP
jgi:multidrug efflux system outer membrane protein